MYSITWPVVSNRLVDSLADPVWLAVTSNGYIPKRHPGNSLPSTPPFCTAEYRIEYLHSHWTREKAVTKLNFEGQEAQLSWESCLILSYIISMAHSWHHWEPKVSQRLKFATGSYFCRLQYINRWDGNLLRCGEFDAGRIGAHITTCTQENCNAW